MIGLVVVTHSNLADGLVAAAEAIVGPLERLRALSLERGEGMDGMAESLARAVKEMSVDGDGVIILTDMFGGTPSNLSMPHLQPGKVEIVTGVNLPMLLKCSSGRERMTVSELASLLLDYGKQNITLVSDLLRRGHGEQA